MRILNSILQNQTTQDGQFKREQLEKKVRKGAEKAIKDYGKTFKILADYDKK